MVTIGSLCSGYGGLDMGLQHVIGGEVRWHFEFDKHASKILETHYPDVPNYGDITATDWDIERVDWLTAGYPCQPFSTAGQRKGTNDARHIWPYIANAIRILRPRGILLENVAGHLSLGFGAVLGDLAEIGYDARWVCLRAADAGAPHSRKRIFIVAHPNSYARSESQRTNRYIHAEATAEQHRTNRKIFRSGNSAATDTASNRRQAMQGQTSQSQTERAGDTWPGFGPYIDAIGRWEQIIGRPAPIPVDDEKRLYTPFVEWMMGVPEGWVTESGIPYGAQLRALGNGVVPQQASLALRLMGVL